MVNEETFFAARFASFPFLPSFFVSVSIRGLISL